MKTPTLTIGLMLFLNALGVGAAPAEKRTDPGDWRANAAAFRSELDALRKPLGIPGLAYVVVHDGQVVVKEAMGLREEAGPAPFTTDTPLRVASVTKALTALLVLKQVEAGALSLDTPVKRHLPDFEGPDGVLLRHLLDHTSEGEVGTEYVYGSSRFGRVGDLLRAASGQTLEQLLRTGVTEPAGMRWYDSPHLGAHGGLVSTVDEMAKLLQALDGGRVVAKSLQGRLAEPSRAPTGEPLPVGIGWFAQDVHGQRVIWSFGQDDPDHSGALLLRVPSRRWSLFVLANRNTLSDPFRLLMGDVRKSPVATAFMRAFVLSPVGQPLPGPGRGTPQEVVARVAAQETQRSYRYNDDLLAEAMTRQWAGDTAGAEALLFMTLERYNLREAPDPVLHFLALTLDTPRSRAWGAAQGERLLKAHPRNRWILFAQANLLGSDPGRTVEAVHLYQTILDLPNQTPDFLHRLFQAWCLTGSSRLLRATKPEDAERRLEQVLQLKVGGDTEAQARRLLAEWRASPKP
ncbi:MAG TPA: serine hydrolase domain-containing protein [Vicinamibacteria bacterium]